MKGLIWRSTSSGSKLTSRADALDNPATRAGVESHADTLGGEPYLTGTRIPAYDVAALMRDCGLAEVLRAFPSLSQAEIDTAVAFAGAVPRQGKRPETVLPNPPHIRVTVTVKLPSPRS
jgi:uncharacterized protein (DUF433 family)